VLSGAQAVAVDDAGNLYIGDTGSHRIRKVTPNGIIFTLVGPGPSGCAAGNGGQPGEEAPAALSRIQSPGGVAVDRDGNLYIADTANHRIREVPAASTCVREGPPAIGFVEPGIIGGKVVSIAGMNLGPAEGISGTLNNSGLLDTSLAGTRVLFDDVPAAILYSQYNQVNAVVPAAMVRTAPPGGQQPANVRIEFLGESSENVTVYVVPSPFLFTADSPGWGQALAGVYKIRERGFRVSAGGRDPCGR